jgi:hypothetical protein
MHKFFCFLFILGLTGCFISSPGKSAKNAQAKTKQAFLFEEYFPLKEHAIYIYHMQFDGVAGGVKIDEIDSCIFKIHQLAGINVYYIDRHTDEQETIIGTNAFCFGAFYFDQGQFMYAPVFWRSELEESKPGSYAPLFSATSYTNTFYQSVEDTKTVKYVFTGFENVQIKSKVYPDCLKLEMTEIWPDKKYTSTAWFMKGVGMVKWIRYTGRVEELKE